MNILLYVNSFLPTVGGKEIVVHYLARELQKLGNRVRVVGPSGWISRRKENYGYPVHRWPTLRGLYPEKVGYAQLSLDAAIWGCDVIHAHTTYPNGYLASLIKMKRHLPLVITPHGHDIHVIPELNFGHRLDPVKDKKIRHALQSAEIVTAISDSVENSLVDAGCEPSKIRKIPNGIDVERFTHDRYDDVRQWLGLPAASRLILSVGNYHPRKGQDIIIEAMPLVLSKIPAARLVIVGGKQGALAKKIDALKLNESVRLTGSIPFPLPGRNNDTSRRPESQDRLAALYCQSGIYVSASINKEAEGLSLAMLDAMAAGLPVVATDISGSRDIIKPGSNGVLVGLSDPCQLAEAIVTILGDENMRRSMGAQGKQTAQNYHWSEIAGKYLEVYEAAVA